MKKLTILAVLLCAVTSIFAQQKKQSANIPYGNNPAAGKYYDIRGIKIYAEVYGEGQPVLLTHGNGGSIAAFSKTIPYFAKKYKVIAVDSRAHGKSTDGRDSLSFEMMADDLSALLDAMHISKSYVIGWSDGGINAIVMAMRHPDKVIKFASTGANLWPDSTALTPATWKDMRDTYAKDKDKPRTTDKEKNDWKIFMLDWLQPNIKLSALSAIQCPSLIICGDHDLIPVEHTNQIFQSIKNGYLWVVPNSGHDTLIGHAGEFNKKVDDFFSKSAF